MQGEARRSAIPHVAALDGARGIAVAGVLLFHGGHLTGGYLGVDFFFTLSGFLITSLLLAESGRTGGIGLGAFWSRRARRLLPALVVLMIGIAFYCVAFATPDQLGQIRGDALATLAYVANWHEIFSHQNYFALFTAPSPLNHTWSLAIEEQFYVIWPLIFVGLLAWWKRTAPKAVLVTALVLAAISSALMFILYSPANVSRAYYGTDTRAAAILFGAALAAWMTMHGPAKSRNARIALEVVGVAGAVFLAIAWTRLGGQSSTLYRGGFFVCGLAGTAVIAAAVHPEPALLSRLLSLRPLCALGLISYGVYLYHWPIDVALDQKQMGFGGWPLFAFQTAVTLAIAVASYRIIEKPIRHGALSTSQLRTLTPAIAIGLVAVLLLVTSGARTLKPITSLRHPLVAATRAFKIAPPGSLRVMVVGDSVAYFLGQAFQTLRVTPPLAVFNIAIAGCAFPSQITQERFHNSNGESSTDPTFACDPSWEAQAVKRFHPDVVIWFTDRPADAVFYRDQWIETCSARYAALYQKSLSDELAGLKASGAKVVMPTEVYPHYAFADENRQTDCENRLRHKVAAATGVQLVDLFAYMCPHAQCRERQDGVVLRPDGLHYEGKGGEIVARWLLSQIR